MRRREAPVLQNSLLNSLLAGNMRGDWFESHCVARAESPSRPTRSGCSFRGNASGDGGNFGREEIDFIEPAVPPSWRGLPQVMGAVALCWRSGEPPPCATRDARHGVLAGIGGPFGQRRPKVFPVDLFMKCRRVHAGHTTLT